MNELIKKVQQKYKGVRYSNLVKGRNNEWWFTISPKDFINSTLSLMLIHKLYKKIFVLKINTKDQLKGIIPRKGDVHLSGQYDLYFILENNSLNIKYLTNKGHIIEKITSNIVELIEFSEFELIENLDDLKDNLLILESYLDLEYSEREQNFAYSLIQNGKNLVAYKIQNEYHFAPSRFIGYKLNNIDKHNKNELKDGRDTTPVINKLNDEKLSFNEDLENAYISYCNSLGIDIYHNKRQYWMFNFTGTSFEKLINTKEYKEGRIFYAKHKRRERNRKLVEDAKNRFRAKNDNRLFCEICSFNFQEIYGIDYIEVHHRKAIADMKDDEVTNVEDVSLVCPNCHRIIHSKTPHFTINEVKKIIEKNKLDISSKEIRSRL